MNRNSESVMSSKDVLVRTDCNMKLYEWGSSGFTCYLVHGFGEGGHVWNTFCRQLPRSIRAIAVDLLGHGDSSWVADREYSVESHAIDLAKVISGLGGQPVILVGHSMGGDVILRTSTMMPDRIRAVVLVDFGPEIIAEGSEYAKAHFRKHLREYGSIQEYVEQLSEFRPLARLATIREFAENALKAVGDRFLLRCDPWLGELDYTPQRDTVWKLIRELEHPLLIMRGSGSALISSSVARRMKYAARSAQYVQINGAGHGVMLDNPEEFRDSLMGFLHDLPRPIR